jgi:membrane-bound lytic murein transglycosylase MltF
VKDKYDEIIARYCKLYELDFALIKAVIQVESDYNTNAISSAGARGLMQLMPLTAKALMPKVNEAQLFEPETNIALGTWYLKLQICQFPEINDYDEKVKFALASYNGGRGYVNRALWLARRHEGKTAMQPGAWQTWKAARQELKREDCSILNKRPDWRQMYEYVDKVLEWQQKIK